MEIARILIPGFKVIRMPFTIFHLGPALFFGLLFFRRINFPTFVIASVILDIEPLAVIISFLQSGFFPPIDYPWHGLFHTFIGGSLVAVVLSFLIAKRYGKVQKIAAFFKLNQKYSAKGVLLASFSGIFLHILLDTPLNTDVKPFFPLQVNPFYSTLTMFELYALCIAMLAAGVALYALKTKKRWDGF